MKQWLVDKIKPRYAFIIIAAQIEIYLDSSILSNQIQYKLKVISSECKKWLWIHLEFKFKTSEMKNL